MPYSCSVPSLSLSLSHRLVKIWDYQNKACVQTLEGHAQNVTAVTFHSELPILLTGSEDGELGRGEGVWLRSGTLLVAWSVCNSLFFPPSPSPPGTVRVWHANTYRLETTLNYGLERVWFICQMRGSNDVAIGYDEGSVMIKVCVL